MHQGTDGELSGKPTEHAGELRKANGGFGDHKLYRVLTEELKFDFVIRFRGNIAVTATSGEARVAADWVGAGGRARTLRGAAVTAEAYPVATVVCVRAKGMKEPWCLAASTADEPARALINLYAKRWEIEGGFRDTKDLRFGMGLGSMHVSTPDRRDRLWLINAFAVVLLTLLGAAGEQLGYDRHLKTNTTKRRIIRCSVSMVRKVHTGLQSFRSIRRIDASCRNASALRLRFSKSLARRRQRLSHAKVRSTTQRIGRTTKPFA